MLHFLIGVLVFLSGVVLYKLYLLFLCLFGLFLFWQLLFYHFNLDILFLVHLFNNSYLLGYLLFVLFFLCSPSILLLGLISGLHPADKFMLFGLQKLLFLILQFLSDRVQLILGFLGTLAKG